jgi:hypothetical protein
MRVADGQPPPERPQDRVTPGRADDPEPVGRAVDRPLLPDVTADEQDPGWGDPYERDDDEHYLREVPPHHGT